LGASIKLSAAAALFCLAFAAHAATVGPVTDDLGVIVDATGARWIGDDTDTSFRGRMGQSAQVFATRASARSCTG